METHHEHMRAGVRKQTRAEQLAARAVLLEKVLVDTNDAANGRPDTRDLAALRRDYNMLLDQTATLAVLLRETLQELVSTNASLQILFNDRV